MVTVGMPISNSNGDYLFYSRQNGENILVGYWSQTKLQLLLDMQKKPQFALEGRKQLRAVTFHFPPYTVRNEGKQGYGGLEVKVMKNVAESLNYELVISETDGYWFGVIGAIMSDAADVGWANFFLTYEASLLLDYTQPYITDNLCFLVAMPQPNPPWQNLIEPMSQELWLAMLTCLVAAGLFVTIFVHVYPPPNGKNMMVFLYIMSFIQVPVVEALRSRALSIVIFSLLYFTSTFFFTESYKGALTSTMTVHSIPKPMDTIEEVR